MREISYNIGKCYSSVICTRIYYYDIIIITLLSYARHYIIQAFRTNDIQIIVIIIIQKYIYE